MSKKYEFGLAYELAPTRRSNESDETSGGSNGINNKFRVLVVGRDVLERSREITASSVVKTGVRGPQRDFVKRRWSNIRSLAQLCEDSDEQDVKKRRLLYSGSTKSVDLTLVAGQLTGGHAGLAPPGIPALRRTRSASRTRGSQ